MTEAKKEIDLAKLLTLVNSDKTRKSAIQTALGLDRTGISKLLAGKRGISGGELLTIAEILEIDAADLAA